MCFSFYPLSLHPFPARKVRGTFETKDEKWKLRVWKRQHTSHSLFEAVRSRWQGHENEVEIHIVQCVFKFQESVRFQWLEFRLKTVFSSKPALGHRYLKTMLEEHQTNISTASTPMLGGIASYSCNQRSVVLYVGQSMSANKSNYHQPLK